MTRSLRIQQNCIEKVIIIGGGIGGLTLERACLDAGVEVTVYEKRSLLEMRSERADLFAGSRPIGTCCLKWYVLLAGIFWWLWATA
jgi:heterodisulfide reductase subunit A-like polyferredoxin